MTNHCRLKVKYLRFYILCNIFLLFDLQAMNNNYVILKINVFEMAVTERRMCMTNDIMRRERD